MPDEPDYYEALQVSPRARPHVIDAAYRNLAHKYHPDVNRNSDAHQRMAELNRAMEILRDPRKRAEYDRRRMGLLAQREIAPGPTAFVFGMVQRVGYSIRAQESLRQLSIGWLVFVGGLVIALVGTGAMVAQLVSDSGEDLQSNRGFEELMGLDPPAGSFRAEGGEPEASPPARAGVPPPATPTPTASPGPAASTPPQALSAVRDDTRPAAGSAGPAATATPVAVAVATPAPAPNATPVPTPPPATPAPQPPPPTPSPARCSAAGPPQLSETGNQVSFTYGDVVSFQAGQPDVLVVDVAGTLVQLEITNATDVQGDLDLATVVSGEGRRSRDGTVIAQLVEVVCPQ